MTNDELRDHFAGLAMQAMLSNMDKLPASVGLLASSAYSIAEAMMDEHHRAYARARAKRGL